MLDKNPTLHLVCGKIGAGKSTLARRLAKESGAVLISEDVWLSRLYPDEMTTVQDYIRTSGRLRGVMGDHVGSLLRAGLSIVLDFPANTVSLRAWMRGIFEGAGAAHQLHYLDTPDAVCRARLLRRNEDGAHEFAASEADFDLIASYFEPPSPDEGFDIRRYCEPQE